MTAPFDGTGLFVLALIGLFGIGVAIASRISPRCAFCGDPVWLHEKVRGVRICPWR